jgi:hypothetical protein
MLRVGPAGAQVRLFSSVCYILTKPLMLRVGPAGGFMSAYYYICVLILLYMCPHTAIYMCLRVDFDARNCLWPHTLVA